MASRKPITKLADLIPDDKNANRGTERGAALLENSLRDYGAGRSILLDKRGKIIAGNKTVEQAGSIGLDDIIVVQTDGTKLVAVQRMDLDIEKDSRAKALAIADNRVGQVSLEWDPAMLAELAQEIDMSNFWSEEELNDLLSREPVSRDAPEAQEERAEELREQWKTANGQIWEVLSLNIEGKSHRLGCGDSTDSKAIGQLMNGNKAAMIYTDPPYGVAYEGGRATGFAGRQQIAGDRTAGLYAPFLAAVDRFVESTAAMYLWFASSQAATVLAAMESNKWTQRCELIWNKNVAQFGAIGAQYKAKHEPCFYAHRKGKAPKWYGPNNEVTVWDCARESVNEHHPTQKPPELAERALVNSSETGDIVLDGFLGSAATMVAAEQVGRLCFGMELDPKYAAVGLQRMKDMGLDPRLVK